MNFGDVVILVHVEIILSYIVYVFVGHLAAPIQWSIRYGWWHHVPTLQLVNRRNVVNNPKENEAACEDFMVTVTEAHILAAAMEMFEMNSLTMQYPFHKIFPEGCCEVDSLQCRNILLLATR